MCADSSASDCQPLRSAFICGCGHSGTTVIANILAGHPDIHLPLYETGMFLFGPERARSEYTALCADARRAGKSLVVEKTPRHIHQLNLIRELASARRFIIPVRDGRDVAASLARRYQNLQVGINRWIVETGIVLAERESPDVYVYRYEDFVQSPRDIVERVCGFLGVEFSEELMHFHKEERLWYNLKEIRKGSGLEGDEHNALRNWQVNQRLFDGRGRWKSQWSAADMAELTEGKGRLIMERFGYL